GRLVRGEKAYGGRHFFGSSEAADRNLPGNTVTPVGAEGAGHVGVDRARRDDVGGDAPAAVLPSDGPGERDEAGPGGGGVGLAGCAQIGADRRDEHEPSPASLHQRSY